MTPLLWFAALLLAATALPSAWYFVAYLATGTHMHRVWALRFYRWAALVVLATFNVLIFKHIVLTLMRGA
jgi:hypothetical protein